MLRVSFSLHILKMGKIITSMVKCDDVCKMAVIGIHEDINTLLPAGLPVYSCGTFSGQEHTSFCEPPFSP